MLLPYFTRQDYFQWMTQCLIKCLISDEKTTIKIPQIYMIRANKSTYFEKLHLTRKLGEKYPSDYLVED